MNIKHFITQYQDGMVQVTPDISYSLKEVIQEDYRLYNAKFLEENDSGGLKKVFYRMIWVIFRTIIMSSDIDLKDLNMRSLNGKGIRTLSLFKLATQSHLLRTFFGKYVDKAMMEMVWFGSSLTKRFNGKVDTVDLRNYITEPHIKDPQERSHAEMCYYSWDEMLMNKDSWSENWNEIEELWEKMQKQNVYKFKVYEFWTWDTMDDGKTHKVCIKYLDTEINTPDRLKTAADFNPYLKLEKFITPYTKKRADQEMQAKLGDEELFPYEQADFFDCPGRWKGFGCGELLKGIQEHYNEYFNLKRKKDILDLRGIFVHKYTSSSNSLTQDFLDNLETGSVLSMDINEDLSRVIIDTKSAEFVVNVDKLYEIMRLVMGVSAQGTGEELPGSTSASGVKANFATQQTTFDFVRERMHHFLQRLMMDGYFEDIMDEITAQEMVAITGSPKDLAEIDRALIQKEVGKLTEQRFNLLDQKPGGATWDEVQILTDLEEAETQKLTEDFKAMGNTRWTKLKKSLMAGLQYIIEFYVTNEDFDKQAKLELYQGLLSNPNFTGSRQAVQDAIFDLTNENPRQFDKTQEEKMQEAEQLRQEMMMKSGSMTAANPNALATA